LRTSAELAEVTKLEEAIDEVRQLGESERLLAEQLLQCCRNFDMEGILNLLGGISKD